MKKNARFALGLAMGLLCACMLCAQPLPVASSAAVSEALTSGAQDQAERARIVAERKLAEARFTNEETACYSKFATHDCLNQARAERRQSLAELRRQEVSLNDAQRKRRGVEQMKKLENRQNAESLKQ